MAASFLRVGRAAALKWVSLETLGHRGAAPSASLCTKLVEPKKSGKKRKEPELQERAQSEAVVSATPEVTKDSIEGKVNGSATEDSFPETATVAEAVDTLQEAAALAVENPAEPEFDISTYKNLQHHNYTTYTFADYDTEMTKYRLPQPSSGRPSPRH
ncbi:NADH dehydrogenase [ubiquinone] flavoprotein 3, mitochondrial isoform X1 [Acipenser oxyrinchus oxyrinchus]|uniref:NADH dehydrogenase [ubiquinone] flavoprotein 3, mitochondrial isoform X1 n=1 Tax=Acipenser oxyrinchus oxyrinchus TaxID=40147 RepID=A0AAD8DG49_ACIOX|nr:NADH dehydrogenase [ubiquinone] flavoprotein 3, mitochondrial isoform X1 [Acipenser oxyrinchus oxyrinchus]